MNHPGNQTMRESGSDSSAASKLVRRIHHSESDGVKAIWDELGNIPLPETDHLSALFEPDPRLKEMAADIERLGQSCFDKPPVDFEFNRCMALQITDDWILNLGRLTFNVSRANRLKLFWTIKEVFGEDARMSGFFYYPPGGFKEWHTDFEDPQMDPEKHWRIYLIKSAEDEKSWFHYLDPKTNEIERIYDYDGHLNFFNLVEDQPLWHGVYSHTHRYSLGIKLGDEAIKNLLDLTDIREAVG